MRIYIANLGAYNEGELKGDWFNLPVDMYEVFETIFDEHELDENGNPYGDWAIHDYELPFEISEQESIAVLNEIYNRLDYVGLAETFQEDYDLSDVINLANELGKENYVEDLIHGDDMDDFVKGQLENDNGWVRLKFLLEGVTDPDADYFVINGYDNVENEDYDLEKTLFRDIITELKSDIVKEFQREREQKQKNTLEP